MAPPSTTTTITEAGRVRFQDPSIRPRNAKELKAWLDEILQSGETDRPELPAHDNLHLLLQQGQLWSWDNNCTIQMCRLANSTGIHFDRCLQQSVRQNQGFSHQIAIRNRVGAYLRPGYNRVEQPLECSRSSGV